MDYQARPRVIEAIAVVGALLVGLGAGYAMAPRSVAGTSNANELEIPGNAVNLAVAAGPMPDMYHFVIGGLLNPTLVLTKGANVTVYFRNIDTDMEHSMVFTSQAPPYTGISNFTLAFPGGETANATTGVPPGGSAVFSFVARASGTYWYVCGIPGHAANGMYGKLIVQG